MIVLSKAHPIHGTTGNKAHPDSCPSLLVSKNLVVMILCREEIKIKYQNTKFSLQPNNSNHMSISGERNIIV